MGCIWSFCCNLWSKDRSKRESKAALTTDFPKKKILPKNCLDKDISTRNYSEVLLASDVSEKIHLTSNLSEKEPLAEDLLEKVPLTRDVSAEVTLTEESLELKTDHSSDPHREKTESAVAVPPLKNKDNFQILDMQQYFTDDLDWNSLKKINDSGKILEIIENGARKLENEVLSFSKNCSSLDHFVLDEKLMIFIEQLDKINCRKDSELLSKKIKVIGYIQTLQRQLEELSCGNLWSKDQNKQESKAALITDFPKEKILSKNCSEKDISTRNFSEGVLLSSDVSEKIHLTSDFSEEESLAEDLLEKVPVTRNVSAEVALTEESLELKTNHNSDPHREKTESAVPPLKNKDNFQILDMQQYFTDDFDWNSLKKINDPGKILEIIENGARKLENEVLSFSKKRSSLDHFVLDEKLMVFIEQLDKINCREDSELLSKKIKVIGYIQTLQRQLEELANKEN